jgi:hypothetical protein
MREEDSKLVFSRRVFLLELARNWFEGFSRGSPEFSQKIANQLGLPDDKLFPRPDSSGYGLTFGEAVTTDMLTPIVILMHDSGEATLLPQL